MARPAILGSILIDIFKRHHLLSVSELLTVLAEHGEKQYNKTSVYRALEKLEEQGIICQHTFETGETKYELRQAHHDHLVCSRCGTIQSANLQIEIPSSVDGFSTQHYHLTVFGLCQACQKKNSE